MPGLQVVKGSHASWCHCIPLHYHEAWVAQHVTLSTHRNGLEAASSPRPATSLLILQMPCSCPLPLLGVLTLGLCHSNWPMGLLQPGRQAKRDWHQSSRPASVQSPSHMTVFSSFLTWKRLFGSSQFSQPYFQRQTAQGRLETSRYPEALNVYPLAGTKRSPLPFCTSTEAAGVNTHHRAVSQSLIPTFLSLRTNCI